MTKKELLSFLGNKENELNCNSCPYNTNQDDWPGGRLPCGQFQCWVDIHCAENADED